MKRSLWWARGVVKILLALVAIGALLGSYGFGAYLAPMLVPFLWLAAWDSGWPMRIFWMLLAAPCAFLTSLAVFYPADSYERSGKIVAAIVLVVFAITPRLHRA